MVAAGILFLIFIVLVLGLYKVYNEYKQEQAFLEYKSQLEKTIQKENAFEPEERIIEAVAITPVEQKPAVEVNELPVEKKKKPGRKPSTTKNKKQKTKK